MKSKIYNHKNHLKMIVSKKLLSITAIFFGAIISFAQVPEKMNYQAVIRNASGQLLQNQNVAVRAGILQGSPSGTVVYSERLTGTTNINGVLSAEIGSGTVISGTFSSINWSSGNYWLKTETDPTGGTNYTIAGTSQLLSVPYAMYAKTSGSGGSSPWTTSGNNIYNSNTGNVGIGNTSPSEKLDVNGKTRTTNLQMTNGAGTGKVLASDANGNASWSQVIHKDVLGITPLEFKSIDNNQKSSTFITYFPAAVTGGSLNAAVHLPNGATITQMVVYFVDNNYVKDYILGFGRLPQGVPFSETLISVTTSGGNTAVQSYTLNPTTPIVIDNTNYFYYFGMSGDFSGNDGIAGVKITYSYPVNN